MAAALGDTPPALDTTPLDNGNHVPIGSAVNRGDVSTWCCDPALGISVTKTLAAHQTVTFGTSTRWVPVTAYDQAKYAGDPYVLSQSPTDTFYLTEQSLPSTLDDPYSSNLGTLEFFVPEPNTWMLMVGGALMLIGTLSRRRP